MPKKINVPGRKFGNGCEIISFSHVKSKHWYYLCKCHCGKEWITQINNIKECRICSYKTAQVSLKENKKQIQKNIEVAFPSLLE